MAQVFFSWPCLRKEFSAFVSIVTAPWLTWWQSSGRCSPSKALKSNVALWWNNCRQWRWGFWSCEYVREISNAILHFYTFLIFVVANWSGLDVGGRSPEGERQPPAGEVGLSGGQIQPHRTCRFCSLDEVLGACAANSPKSMGDGTARSWRYAPTGHTMLLAFLTWWTHELPISLAGCMVDDGEHGRSMVTW